MNIARYQDKKKKKNLKSKTPAYKNRNIASDSKNKLKSNYRDGSYGA